MKREGVDELTAEGLWPGREGRLPLGLAALASKAWEPRPAAEWLRKGLPNAGVHAPGGVSTPSLEESKCRADEREPFARLWSKDPERRAGVLRIKTLSERPFPRGFSSHSLGQGVTSSYKGSERKIWGFAGPRGCVPAPQLCLSGPHARAAKEWCKG